MNPQAMMILVVFCICAGSILIGMSWIASTTREPPEPQTAVTPPGYRLRRRWLWVLAGAAALAFGISLAGFPYGKAAAGGALHFKVFAYQYGFTLPATVPADVPVVFDVTSRDVNHGFGIYDPGGHLFSQVQAMPGYVNHLAVTFKTKGHYTIRCLEYCGIAHAAMQGGFVAR